MGNLLDIEVKYRELISIKRKKVDKGDYLITHFRNAVPGQFFMRCGSSKILQLSNQGGKQAGNAGGKRKYHSYLVLFYSKCRAHVYGCETTYKAGFEEDQLRLLALEGYAPIQMQMHIIGKCIHQVGKAYSICRVIDRQIKVDKVLDMDKLVPPLEVTKRNLSEVDAERLTAKNFGGIAATRDHIYEIN